ncbi:MAG: immunity protein YezG family protein [Clostridia bacterium]
MLNHTKKIKEIYEDIQKKLFYMIPEKWESLYLYSSVIDLGNNEKTGELFFYYIPKGIFRKNPVNVYEIPTKFNIEENQYLQLVEILYNEIKMLREEFKKSETGKLWTNITISIQDMKFKVEYRYDDLLNDIFDSYERHVIWRYKYLGIGIEQVGKKEKEILERYFSMPKQLEKKEEYSMGVYIEQDIKNIIEYNTETDQNTNEYEYNFEQDEEEYEERKYNQFRSTKIENTWDNRKKKKSKKPLQIDNFGEFNVTPFEISENSEKHREIDFNLKNEKTKKKRNQILFSDDEFDI